MSFCGNVLELVEKLKIIEDTSDFIQWNNIEGDPGVEVFIEESILPELESETAEVLLIDAVVGTLPNGEKMGMLFLKNPNKDVYGF